MLNWANRFNIFCFLDNNQYKFEAPAFDCLLAVGSVRVFNADDIDGFAGLKSFYDQKPSFLFGHFGYDFPAGISPSTLSGKPPLINFKPCFFFEPKFILRLSDDQLTVTAQDDGGAEIFRAIENEILEEEPQDEAGVFIENDLSKQQYLDIVQALRNHIHRGDCYEINFCQQFFARNASLDPLKVFEKLSAVSPNPFAALYKIDGKFCICASPERYLKKTGLQLISQPIKGTAKRDPGNPVNDEANRNYLRNSQKERSENVMIVDLVRNDLSKICQEGTVEVKELFGTYSFPQVHQMISTISGEMQPHLHWTDAIKATFPMGSMTGAPKKKVMELIARYETAPRGLFSGTIGYIDPAGDFDFNVVIRSIFYDQSQKDLCFFAGGGITYNSKAEEEYEESLLKAAAIIKVLG